MFRPVDVGGDIWFFGPLSIFEFEKDATINLSCPGESNVVTASSDGIVYDIIAELSLYF